MKAFEEWWKENKYGKNHTPSAKDTWKAALEWALSLKQTYETDGPENWDYIEPCELQNELESE